MLVRLFALERNVWEVYISSELICTFLKVSTFFMAEIWRQLFLGHPMLHVMQLPLLGSSLFIHVNAEIQFNVLKGNFTSEDTVE